MNNIIDSFHKVAQLRRENLFRDDRLMPITHREDANTAAPGWVGHDYQPGSIVLLGINPGGGGDAYRGNPTDRALYGRLRAFRDASPQDLEAAFTRLNESWLSIQQTHSLWRVISAALDATGLRSSQVAFLNMLPFRTREDKTAPSAVMANAWRLAAQPQIRALAPKAIVTLGFKAADALDRLANTGSVPRVFRLKRARGDTRITDEARATLAELHDWMDSRG